jgi:CHAT domain
MFKVVIGPNNFVMVGDQIFYNGLGFQRNASLNASIKFVKILYNLSNKVAAKQRFCVDILDDESDINFQKSLFVDNNTCNRTLSELIEISAPLRSDLSDEIVSAFKSLGFLKDNTQEAPAFTFLEDVARTNSPAPVLWEMMYEGDVSDDPQWQDFWGFKVPIANWITGNRTNEIRLQKTFVGIHEDLKFAGKETDLLATKIAPRLTHTNLLKECRERVEKDVENEIKSTSEEQELGGGVCQDSRWLFTYLKRLFEKNEDPSYEAQKWKEKTLVSIFKNSRISYDLLHFACHCESSDETGFLSQLIMKVAGEPISLNVGFIKAALKRKNSWENNERGPLIFLNACGTFEQNVCHEPPGFPIAWINSQGALAVIGTLCPVPDYFAYAFAKKFYEILFQAIPNQNIVRECYLSEALLITRRYFMETYNNPLGLAYVLYAVGGAHVLADFVQTGDAA